MLRGTGAAWAWLLSGSKFEKPLAERARLGIGAARSFLRRKVATLAARAYGKSKATHFASEVRGLVFNAVRNGA